jgi:hypothetical protein
LAVGAVAIFKTASVACKMRRARVGRGACPPSVRLDVLSMATRKPATYHCPATRWSLADLVAPLQQRRIWTMSRSSIWRVLDEADLKPHRSVYWLNSHDPDFEAKAHDMCALSLNALRFFEQGRVVSCSDEKTGMQILQRTSPPQPIAPGKPEKREHEYSRHGVRALIASFVVPTGHVVWNLGETRTSADFAAHLASEAISVPPKISKPVCMTLLRSITRITPIHTVGRIWANPWYGPRRSLKRVVNNVMVGRGLAHGLNDLNVPFIRPDLISGPQHDWQRTYEMDI